MALAERQGNTARLEQLRAMRTERFALLDQLTQLPPDMVFFTPITMEAAEDPAFLTAMRCANIKGALVGVEAVTPEGLKDVYKGFNDVGDALVQRLRTFREHGVFILGSFIFVLTSRLSRQMYANTGIATDSARVNRANRWARLIAKPCLSLFTARPLPALERSRPQSARTA